MNISSRAQSAINRLKAARPQVFYRINHEKVLTEKEFKSLKPHGPYVHTVAMAHQYITPALVRKMQKAAKIVAGYTGEGRFLTVTEYKRAKKLLGVRFVHDRHGKCYLFENGILAVGCQVHPLSRWENPPSGSDLQQYLNDMTWEDGSTGYQYHVNKDDFAAALPLLKMKLLTLRQKNKKS